MVLRLRQHNIGYTADGAKPRNSRRQTASRLICAKKIVASVFTLAVDFVFFIYYEKNFHGSSTSQQSK